jgi:hydrogenase maturation protein HypF
VLSVDVFRRAIDDLLDFFQATPDAVVCDLHPDYASTRYAESLAARYDVPLLRVQHHHAHVAACMAEHGLQGPVLGFSWDGAGYGPDRTVWGCETLWCDGAAFRRVAHLRTFALPGGDRAMHEPRRSALGALFEILGPQAAEQAASWFDGGQIDTLMSMLARRVNSPRTSSMGRLFDAVAAICGLPPAAELPIKPRPVVAPRNATSERSRTGATTGRGFVPGTISFEGQAAMALEFAADEHDEDAYLLPVSGGLADGPLVADWEPLVRSVLTDRAAGVPVGRISARFHNALADMALAIARAVSPPLPIVLTGGCFQNALLAARVRARLSAAGFEVYTHHQVPPGDGGIALGQALVALRELQGSSDVSRNSR